jgi:membrane protein YqaA with SNARE-associated domain
VFASLCVAAGVAFGSALVPLISVEIFVLALVTREPALPCLALGAVVAAAQVGGKLLYYLAARGSLHLPKFMHRTPKPLSERRLRWQQRTKRIRAWVELLTEKCHRHPHWMAGTYGISSVVGLPPFMATTVLAGLARMSMATFLATGLAGRWIRFSLLAASPALVHGLF